MENALKWQMLQFLRFFSNISNSTMLKIHCCSSEHCKEKKDTRAGANNTKINSLIVLPRDTRAMNILQMVPKTPTMPSKI